MHDIFHMSEKQFDLIYRQALKPKLTSMEKQRHRLHAMLYPVVFYPIFFFVIFSFMRFNERFLLLGWPLLVMILLSAFTNKKTFRIIRVPLWVIIGYWIFSLLSLELYESGSIDYDFLLSVFMLVVWYLLGLFCIVHIQKLKDTSKRGAQEYPKAYKNLVIPQLLKSSGKSLAYMAEPEISPQMLNESDLLIKQVSSVGAQHGISGYLGKARLTVAEITAKQRKRLFFKGIFCRVEFAEKFDGWVRVYPKRCASLSGRVYSNFEGYIFDSSTSVQLDDAEFDARFIVYSNSRAAAHAILTPQLRALLVAFYLRRDGAARNFSNTFALSVRDNMAYATMPTHKNLLEPDLTVAADDPRMINRMLSDLKTMLSIVGALNIHNNY